MNLVSPNGASSVDWIRGSLATQSHQPLTWYKVRELQIKRGVGGEEQDKIFSVTDKFS